MVASAFDRLTSQVNLATVWKDYRPRAINSAAGINGLSPKDFDHDAKFYIKALSHDLRDGFCFSKLRGVKAPKSDPTKFRIICVPTIQDRLVQRAILKEVEARAIELGIANEVSFGFVKDTATVKRGTGTARDVAIKHRRKKPWAFKADIESFFDRIDRKSLSEDFAKTFSLRSLAPLVVGAISCEVDDTESRIKRVLKENGIVAGRGLRQGMPLSPVLSNFLLRDFDKSFVARGHDLVRYADDILVFASSKEECEVIKAFADKGLEGLGLKFKESKTRIYAPDEAADFLGMELYPTGTPSAYSLRISDKQRAVIKEQFTNFNDLDTVIKEDLDAFKLTRRLRNMSQGYRSAYAAADNFREIEQQFVQWQQGCFVKIYERLFGPGAIDKLPANGRKFLMI